MIQSQALTKANQRYAFNIALIWNWMLPPFVVILSLLVISVLVEIIWIRRFDKTDACILSTVILCFSTEVIFYFTVIYRSQLISDMEVIQLLLGNAQIAKLTGFTGSFCVSVNVYVSYFFYVYVFQTSNFFVKHMQFYYILPLRLEVVH